MDSMDTEKRLLELGYTLPTPPTKGGVYTPVKEFGAKLAYVSGHVSNMGGTAITGKLGADCSFEDGQKAADMCALNLLATLKAHLCDLDKIKILCEDDGFRCQPPGFLCPAANRQRRHGIAC
jgi:enamine deaminase RidA (YjgF/YER057c/UK114 family)